MRAPATSDVTARPARGAAHIVDGPIEVARIRDDLADPTGGTGALVLFLGVVRADRHGAAPVERLEFECYPEMAGPELDRIRDEAIARWSLRGFTIQHRTGALRVGEDIVAVAAAGAHRKEAFAAAAWAMDEIKRRVPLWKREVAADGTTRWVPGDECRCMDA